MTCCNLQDVPTQTLFLGCSIVDFSTSLQWGDGVSDLNVNLVADFCPGARIYYDSCLNAQSGNYEDLGFVAEDLYQRVDGTKYSSCIKEDVSDTKLRDRVEIIGCPVLFKYGSFEYSGIVSDWNRSNSASAPSYRVKIVDPRLILEGVQLIIGSYTGAVNQNVPVIDGGTGEPQTNLFNIYGYLEQFGLICPSYSQCSPGVYNLTSVCPTAVDGPSFGSLVGGFGGSLLNNEGMPYNYIVTGFNFLANATPVIQNYWSAYGRVSYFSNDITVLNGSGCGLIEPDTGSSYFANKNYYYVDLTELPAFPDNTYRISGTSISLLDLITKASQDLNFDFYFELLPVKDVSTIYGGNCVAKIIKLRTVSRYTQPSLDKICSFIENSDCVLESSVGQELRNETVSKFIIGGQKQTIYQAFSGSNPDGGSTSAITSIDSYYGGLRTDTGCNEIDDMVLPYFGTDFNGDLIVPCKVSGIWQFEAPTWGIQGELQIISFSGSSISINENELRAASKDYSSWEGYAAAINSDSWRTIYPSGGPAIQGVEQAKTTVAGGKQFLPHDIVNPKLGKFRENIDPASRRFQEDKEAIYSWIRSYATDFYGKKFAVRVPFTCVKVDVDSLQPIISESPTNDGGWTEVSGVLGLPNGGSLTLGQYEYLNFFRDSSNKITPFVRFTDAVLKTVGSLNKDYYLYKYEILSGSPDTGNGPPSGVPSSSICYQDNLTDIIYVYSFDQWLPINNSCVLHGSGSPTITGTQTPLTFCPVYYNVENGDVYIAGNSTYLGSTGVNVGSWNITASVDLYVKAQVEEEYVYHDKSNYFAPRVVVEVPEAVKYVSLTPAYIDGAQKALEAVADGDSTLQGNNAITNATHPVGGDAAFMNFDYQASLIYAAAIPLRHNTLTYGPWYNPTITGRVEIVNDSNLVPWRYNGHTGLNLAGLNLANESRVNMYKGELGTITIPGYPTIPLGAELNAINDGYYASSEHLIENRVPQSGSISGVDYNGNLVYSAYARFAFPSTWTGSYGPNVTDIQVGVNQGGFQSTYNMRTFAPRRGFFERYRANRLEALSVRANKVADILREEEAARKRRLLFEGKGRNTHVEHDVKQKHRSVNLIAGQEIDSGTGKRTAVAGMPMVQGNYEVQHQYENKAFMSWDGLLRPFSVDGDGGLSPFIKYTGTSGILQDDLNPFTNPGGYSRNRVATVRNDSSGIGHDFEVLGRSGADTTGLINQATSGDLQYSNDYRAMALRGPLIMKGWGYDISGYPVPNKADTEIAAASGIFTTSSLDPTKFLDGHLQKPHTWVTAPIDLRLDRDRGVWVAGNSSATPADTATANEEIVLIYISGNRDACCLYPGFHRPLILNGVDPCNSTMDYQEVYVYHHCDILSAADCILGKYKIMMPSSGCHPSGLIYQFLGLSESPDALVGSCDCCCPPNTPSTAIIANIVSSCNSQKVNMLYATGINTFLSTCSGADDLAAEGFTVPFDGWLSDPFYCTRPYPVILKQVELIPSGESLPDVFWVRTDYTTWEVHSVYSATFDLIPDLTGYTFSSDNGLGVIMPDVNNNDEPVFDDITFKYRMVLQCPEGDKNINNGTISILHMTPETYPISGVIPDIGRLQNTTIGCALNTQWYYFTPHFGDGVTCGINISLAGGSYNFDPFFLHWYCMCECSPSGYPLDYYPNNAAKNSDCTLENIRVRFEW